MMKELKNQDKLYNTSFYITIDGRVYDKTLLSSSDILYLKYRGEDKGSLEFSFTENTIGFYIDFYPKTENISIQIEGNKNEETVIKINEKYIPNTIATKEYVDDSIANIDVPEVDLTSYYTKEEADNQNVNSLDFYIVKGANSLPSSGGANTLGSATSTIIANIRESAKRKRLAAFYDTTNYILWYPQYTLDSLAKSATGLKLNYVGSGAGIAGLSGNSGSTQRSMGSTYLYVYVNIDEEGNITKSPDSYSPNIGMNSSQSYLSIWNTKAFTPTGDYHPATKKYVDDSIANIDIPETDLTNYFTKEEMKTTYLGLPILEIPFELSEIQNWITENVVPYATENGWDSFYLKFTGLSGDIDQNYFKGLYFLESFHDISEEEERDYKIYYFKNIGGYVHRIVDRAEYTDLATMYPAIALYLNADNSVKGFETASVSDIGTNSATALRTDIDYRTPYMPLYDGSPATKLYVDNKVAAIRTPKSHDGEGMIGWYGTAVAGDNLTELYGVTPDMVRAVKAGDYISWPSRVQTGATENTICLYNMTYEVYNKDEMENLETIDIKIGKSPDTTYTYVIVGDNVYKETF